MGWLEDLSAGASGVVNTVGGAVTNAANTVGGYVSGAFNAGAGALTNAANAGAGALTNAANQAQTFINPPPSTQSSNSGAVRSDSTNTYTGYVNQETPPTYIEPPKPPSDLITMGVGNNLYATPTNQTNQNYQNSQSQYSVVRNAPTVLPPDVPQRNTTMDILKTLSVLNPLTLAPIAAYKTGEFIYNNKDIIVNKYNEITSPYVTDKNIYEPRPQKRDMLDDIISSSMVTPLGATGVPILAGVTKVAYDWYTKPFQQVKEGTVSSPSQKVDPTTTRLDLTMPQSGKDIISGATSIYNKYGGSNITEARTVIEKRYEEVKPKVIQTGIDLIIEPKKVKQSIFPDKPYSNEYEVITQTSESKDIDKLITISKFSPLAITGMPMFFEGAKGLYDAYITPHQQLKGQSDWEKRFDTTNTDIINTVSAVDNSNKMYKVSGGIFEGTASTIALGDSITQQERDITIIEKEKVKDGVFIGSDAEYIDYKNKVSNVNSNKTQYISQGEKEFNDYKISNKPLQDKLTSYDSLYNEGISKGYVKSEPSGKFTLTTPLTKVDTYNMILSDATTSKFIPKDNILVNKWSKDFSNLPVINMAPKDMTESFARGVIQEVRDRPFDIGTDIALTVATLPLGGEGAVVAKGATTVLKAGRFVKVVNYVRPFATPSNILTGLYVASAGSNIAFSDNKSETAGRESVHLLANILPISRVNPMMHLKFESTGSIGKGGGISAFIKDTPYGGFIGKDINTGRVKSSFGNMESGNSIGILDGKVIRVKPVNENIQPGQISNTEYIIRGKNTGNLYNVEVKYDFNKLSKPTQNINIKGDAPTSNMGRGNKYSAPDNVIKAEYKFVDNVKVNNPKPTIKDNAISFVDNTRVTNTKPKVNNNAISFVDDTKALKPKYIENRVKVFEPENRVKVFESNNKLKIPDTNNRVTIPDKTNRVSIFEGSKPPIVIDTPRPPRIFEPERPPKWVDNNPYKPIEFKPVVGGRWIGAVGGGALGFVLPNIGGLIAGGLNGGGGGGGGGGGSNKQGQRGFTETFDIGTGIGDIGILEGGLSLKKKRVNPYGGK